MKELPEDAHNEQLVLVLEKDEEIISSLKLFCQSNDIKSGWLSGIGAFTFAELAVYDLKTKKYITKEFSGTYELVGLSGNISTMDNQHILHIHTVLADDNFHAVGGHLNKAIVGATCEIHLNIFHNQLERKFDSQIGLNLIK